MADFGAPVAQNVQTPNGLQTLSGLMNLRQQQQGLDSQNLQIQQQKQNLQKGAAETQMTQQSAGQRQGIAGIDWAKYDDGTGTISTDKMLGDTELRQRAGDQFPQLLQQAAAARTQQLQNKQSIADLNGNLRSQFGSVIGALREDPDVKNDTPEGRQKVTDAITNFGAAGGPDAMKVAQIYAPVAQHAPPGQLQRGISAIQLQAEDAGRQAAAQAPSLSFVPTQGGTQPFNANPQAGGGVGPVGKPLIPPNQTIATTGGGTALVNMAAGTVQAFKPQENAPQVDFPAGENGNTQAELQLQRTAAQSAANQAPTMHNLNRGIIQAVDSGVTTGKWGAFTQDIASKLGYNLSGNEATDYNMMGKLLERNAIAAAQGMGPHTNAGLEAQVRANGSLDYTPQALRKIAALNDALTTGSTMYQSGLEGSISGSGGNVFSKRQFDQKWASAMNPSSGVDGVQALRFKNAVDNADSTEQAAILKEVGGRGSKGANALLGKMRSLQQLSGSQ
jgi:hypothetical protein